MTLSALLFVSMLAGAPGAQAVATPAAAPPDVTVTGPFTHANLAVFLVHGKDALPGKKWITLEEALAAKTAKVYETGEVNQLAIENVGSDEVFIQAGDIVKGGRQDRTLAVDLVLAPKSGRLPIESFCVESGRWSGRGGESAAEFSGSTEQIATKEMKLAARKDGDQEKVWQEVANTKAKLAKNLKANVDARESQSSLELTLENGKVRETEQQYVDALAKIADGQDDVIGYAFAINGAVNSAEIYASKDLFRKLWPKLLKASAVEAIAEADGKNAPAPKTEDVKATFADAERGKTTVKPARAEKRVTKETDQNVMFETDLDGAGWLHRTYIRK